MLKKLLALLLCAVLLTALAACGGGGEPVNTDSSVPGNTAGSDVGNGSGGSDTNSAEGSEDAATDLKGYDENAEHLFLATDIKNYSIVVFDLALANGDFQNLANGDQCVVWEWKPSEDPNCIGRPATGLDAAKLRYSPYYEKDVVIVCSSGGWAGIVDYEERTILWEWQPKTGNFHSIEMMPNGDIVIAGSGDSGQIYYIPLSAGEVTPSHTISSPHGHGVMYDPQNEWLWVLDYDEVYACSVKNYGQADAKLSRIGGIEAKFGNDKDGHVLSPVYGEPGKYWVANSTRNYQFDSESMTLTKALTHYNDKGVKGIAFYPDNTMIMTVSGTGNHSNTWSCGEIRVVTMEVSTGKVQKLVPTVTDVSFPDREFYKVHPFTKDYQ